MASFAHLWGLDEVAIYAIPAVLAIVALRWADKKARSNIERRNREQMPIGSPDHVDDR
ncbi:MAG: hypothetical protein ACLFRT_14975 [Actinomycetota bacterium]